MRGLRCVHNRLVPKLSTALHWLSRQPWFGAIGRRLVWLDRLVQRVTRGRWSAVGAAGLRSALLTTTGRRSGKPRHTPLLCIANGDGYLVVGSNWGQRHHPAWTANLLADPRAVLTMGGKAVNVSAELLTDQARAVSWAVLTAAWPPYQDYERRAGRVLRVFRLVPERS